jgi:hypothetical protein
LIFGIFGIFIGKFLQKVRSPSFYTYRYSQP